MTEREDFLARWSRRKREAKVEPDQPNRDRAVAPEQAKPDESPQHQVAVRASDAPARDAASEVAFDISKLPSLDSIGAATDIRMFLQPGVPEALSRAALRRAWSADPGIRDFVGLAENAWDFTASDGMHGFGPLDPADAKRLLAQLFSESEPKAGGMIEGEPSDVTGQDALSDAEPPQNEASHTASPSDADGNAVVNDAVRDADIEVPQRSNPDAVVVASQQKQAERPLSVEPMRRSRGRALPQ